MLNTLAHSEPDSSGSLFDYEKVRYMFITGYNFQCRSSDAFFYKSAFLSRYFPRH